MSDTTAETKYFPTQAGTFLGYEPQWRHKQPYGSLNKQLAPKVKGGDIWTKVPFTIFRGQFHIELPDGTVVSVGVPFPRASAGILETIFMCGWEQANALAWDYAAHAAAIGAAIEVRVVDYEIKYDIKARQLEPEMTAERLDQ